jgi:hypothetical protein
MTLKHGIIGGGNIFPAYMKTCAAAGVFALSAWPTPSRKWRNSAPTNMA